MYVLCSLAVWALHSLYRSWKGGEPSRSPGARSNQGGRAQVSWGGSRFMSFMVNCGFNLSAGGR